MNLLFDISLNKEDNLLRCFEDIHDYIYANDGLSPQQTLEEFVKILFIKIFEESNGARAFCISEIEWSTLKSGKPSDVFSNRINGLFKDTKHSFLDIFDVDDKIRISNISLGYTIDRLQGISLTNSSQDAKGLAFQKFLSHHEKDGRGQFFTPEPVIDFCVSMMRPKPTERIIDPACGSGGFLMSALKYIKTNNESVDIAKIVESNLFGLDINKSIARIAKMKLLLESNTKTNIMCTNSLESNIDENMKQPALGTFDLVLANPPFGAKITNANTLSAFDMGYKWTHNGNGYQKTKNIYQNQNAEILFIERCLDLLKEGGRMAVVLPNGNFENPSLEYLRHYIKLRSRILSIVNLPQETFIPFGTGVKTSILFIEKETPNKITEYPIFFGRVKKLGYQGNKNGTVIYKKDTFGQILKSDKGNPIIDEDFSEISEAYKLFCDGKHQNAPNSFAINYKELNGRFDYDFYSPENRQMFDLLGESKSIRLGDICEVVKSKSLKLKNQNMILDYIELSDVNTHSFEIINSTSGRVHELPSRASYELKEGDIITAIAGNSVGSRKQATAFVTKEHEGCICSNGFRVLRNFKIDPFYLLFFFKSDVFLKQMLMYRTGAAIPNVSDSDFLNILINVPNEKSLSEIVEKMKRYFELKKESKRIIDNLSIDFVS